MRGRFGPVFSFHLLHALARPLKKVVTQSRVVSQTRGAGERFLRIVVVVEHLQEVSPRGPVG